MEVVYACLAHIRVSKFFYLKFASKSLLPLRGDGAASYFLKSLFSYVFICYFVQREREGGVNLWNCQTNEKKMLRDLLPWRWLCHVYI